MKLILFFQNFMKLLRITVLQSLFSDKMDLELGPLLENDLDDNWIKENSSRELSI